MSCAVEAELKSHTFVSNRIDATVKPRSGQAAGKRLASGSKHSSLLDQHSSEESPVRHIYSLIAAPPLFNALRYTTIIQNKQ